MNRPSNYFFNVTGEEAERLLSKYGSEGDYLVRRSESQTNGYTLSILRQGLVTHIKVNCHGNGSMDLFEGVPFYSLPELIQHYKDNPDQLQIKGGGNIIIKRPLSVPMSESAAREVRLPAAQRWFHANITGEEAMKRLEREKPHSFLVRESQRTPGSYAITVKAESETVHILIHKNPKTGMYSVGGGDEFISLQEMFSHYAHSPMVQQKCERVVYLSHVVPSTSVPADAIDERIKQLSEINAHNKKSGFWEEFDVQADEELLSKREGKKDKNIPKNRYKNIVPFDHTRVVITDLPVPHNTSDTDYINANYINVPESVRYGKKQYISTQGCMENTVVDFWRMVWQVNSRVIVMTTRVVERGKSKCFQYWPELWREQNIRGYYVKNVGEEATKDRDGYDIFIKRRFMISRNGQTLREVFHLQFVGWPDHGCPACPETVLLFLETANELYMKAPEEQGPMIVHCSAGIGRTGTFIVIDILLSIIRTMGAAEAIDIPWLVKKIRGDRSGMVQTEDQYEFLYRAISAYIRNIHRRCSLLDCDKPRHLPPPPMPIRHKSGSTDASD